jgi:diaminopimelate epimerase
MAFAWLKGHGTENDFVLLPDADGSVHGALEPAFVAALCDRRRGIGADGVLRVTRTEALSAVDAAAAESASEWFMDYRNADGSVSEMCGNGIRVFAKHLFDAGLADSPAVIGTRAGDRTVTDHGDGTYSVTMGPADVRATSKVAANGRAWEAQDIRTGNPHAVAFVDDLADAGPLTGAPEHDKTVYPDGVNVEFVVWRGPGHIAMRVHERGSGETRSCGTGACAAAVAAMLVDQTMLPATYRVDVPGGTLHVGWDVNDELTLTGPAEIVARGELEWLS